MRVEVGPGDLAACRYRISPLGEAVSALRVISGHSNAGVLTTWTHRLRPRYERLRREVPAAGALVALFRAVSRQRIQRRLHPAATGCGWLDLHAGAGGRAWYAVAP